jgi:hypothetical protein
MGSIDAPERASKFILTAEALNKALPDMHMATRAIHADDFVSPHRAIAPGMHTAVNFRYARDPEDLVPEENKDVRALKLTLLFQITILMENDSRTLLMIPTYTLATRHRIPIAWRSCSVTSWAAK